MLPPACPRRGGRRRGTNSAVLRSVSRHSNPVPAEAVLHLAQGPVNGRREGIQKTGGGRSLRFRGTELSRRAPIINRWLSLERGGAQLPSSGPFNSRSPCSGRAGRQYQDGARARRRCDSSKCSLCGHPTRMFPQGRSAFALAGPCDVRAQQRLCLGYACHATPRVRWRQALDLPDAAAAGHA